MVKIISRKSLGTQWVYDIGVERDHNFVLENSLIASNCFNKSHSTAYGYVTFQTAYLKANYPVEYMAALLTANSDDQDKVQKYISSCTMMGITVEPPDINRSGVDFTPLERSILFGLSAVRNVGAGAIENILQAREADGPFKSLGDLCSRIDPRTVNRRALEALIQCGAMDCIETNRRQLMNDLDLVLEWAQSRAKDRAIGQGNLFDMLGSISEAPGSFESAPKAPAVEDFPQQERLKLEKELLGFYVSDHPLKNIREAARILAPINLSSLEEQPEGSSISAIAMLTGVKPVVTKKGDRMAIIQLEDLTGHSEAVVFPRTYERIGSLIVQEARLMIWGKVDKRDERSQLIVEDAEPVEDVQLVMVELDAQIAGDIVQQNTLREVILKNRGDEDQCKTPVVAIVAGAHRRELVRLGNQFRVQDYQAAVTALNRAGFRARSTALTSAS
ncbi:trans-splicing intein-formed DNA polymerase III subunit alpha C-terminal partner DnaE-C [Thermoleptolyngbya sichuanensis A183]|uniref:Trans-splicing intein-formed DNA polymerase III subunit alpha C-terminal partner DnaE-C n=1 Tax=Thermoleptolyngbya sichuanensis A183 TaxID=2737172 RepID=A0A6M8BDB4_9CYAN|nr:MULTISPECIES: OB-fold nucleic acid binding domain-containing protein [Thermoleptolyngbya]MDG2615951.1 trans-splicing intein-formed DNA polymerase III subunit alpha C-terminal partner DnaE-C [Thermoleptolyngbya sichuanensis XZ-Cy5]QKD81621.1 trans-splicing intein-formed DNA polymerase III subunit alpha C-terminal partner DnaE-C [Thermoleptolyngbya sichuanensis A183]